MSLKEPGCKRQKSLVLLSGGLDSCVALSCCIFRGDETRALFINYGQASSKQEEQAARAQARHFEIPIETVNADFLGLWSNSALFNSQKLPTNQNLSGREARDSAKAVWVPARNAVFVSIAAAYAESHKMDAIIIGCNREEGETFKDNRPSFISSATEFLRNSTQNEVFVDAPLIEMDKRGIIKEGLKCGAPLELVWSCYSEGDYMCGKCESCLRLKNALTGCGLDYDGIRFMRQR